MLTLKAPDRAKEGKIIGNVKKEEFVKEWNKSKKKTSYSMSGVHFRHYK